VNAAEIEDIGKGRRSRRVTTRAAVTTKEDSPVAKKVARGKAAKKVKAAKAKQQNDAEDAEATQEQKSKKRKQPGNGHSDAEDAGDNEPKDVYVAKKPKRGKK
jgi:hypothetical protein